MKILSKRLCALMASCMLAGTILSGCSTKPSKSPTPTAAEVKLDKVALKMVLIGDKPKDTDLVYAEVNKKLQKDINASIDVTFLSWAEFGTKYPLMFATGEDFDLVYTSSWCQYSQQAVKDGFLELKEDMLKKYAPETFAKVTKDQWTQTSVNGKIFMVPFTSNEYNRIGVLVRGDLRKKYNLPELKTPEDLIKYWDAVKANEKDLLPINAGGADDANFIRMALGVGSDDPSIYPSGYANFNVLDKNAKPVSNLDANYLEKLITSYKYMNELQKKGYWSKNALSNKVQSLDSFVQGTSASAVRGIINLNATIIKLQTTHPEFQAEMYDLLPNATVMANSVTNNGMAIHATSKNPERALMVLDLFRNNKDYFDLTVYGIKGTHYDAVGDTEYKPLAAASNYPADSACQWGWRTDLYRNGSGGSPNYSSILEGYKKIAVTIPAQLFNFDNSSVKTENAAVNAVGKNYDPILSYGFDNKVEALIQKRNDELKKAGYDKIFQEYSTQYDKFLADYTK